MIIHLPSWAWCHGVLQDEGGAHHTREEANITQAKSQLSAWTCAALPTPIRQCFALRAQEREWLQPMCDPARMSLKIVCDLYWRTSRSWGYRKVMIKSDAELAIKAFAGGSGRTHGPDRVFPFRATQNAPA